MFESTIHEKKQIEASAAALQTLAADIHECSYDPEYVAIRAFRCSLAVLTLRGAADRMQAIQIEAERVRTIIERAADSLTPVMHEAEAVIAVFDYWFPPSRLEDLGVERGPALEHFARAVARSEGGR
jgi:hypothetical protein